MWITYSTHQLENRITLLFNTSYQSILAFKFTFCNIFLFSLLTKYFSYYLLIQHTRTRSVKCVEGLSWWFKFDWAFEWGRYSTPRHANHPIFRTKLLNYISFPGSLGSNITILRAYIPCLHVSFRNNTDSMEAARNDFFSSTHVAPYIPSWCLEQVMLMINLF